ncbi:MAG: hypothetical protein IPO24_16785 [Bacteroidetes bacterium]|nr:hypothetical protein [Bacteroidota bacterium]
MSALSPERANVIIDGFLTHVGDSAQIATIGWCMGGGYSMQASLQLQQQGAGRQFVKNCRSCFAIQVIPLRREKKHSFLSSSFSNLTRNNHTCNSRNVYRKGAK